MRSRWKTFRHWLEWLGVSLLAALIPRLSRQGAIRFGEIAGALAARLDLPGRRVAFSNLKAAFGEQVPSSEQGRIVRESYQQFASTMVDLFWSPRLTSENYRDHIEFGGFEEFDRTVGVGNSAIFACFHYGNFEWLSLGCAWAGLKTSLITQEFKNPKLDPIFNHLRQRSGHQVVAREGGVVRLYKTIRRGGSIAILIDLTLHPRQPSVPIDCFGLKTSVTFAHAWLYQRTGAPIVPLHAEPLPGGRCRIMLHPKLPLTPEMSFAEIAQHCWNRFEPIVRQNPSPWLWMYKYWRYRPRETDRSYPSYSHPVPRFDKMIRQTQKAAASVKNKPHERKRPPQSRTP